MLPDTRPRGRHEVTAVAAFTLSTGHLDEVDSPDARKKKGPTTELEYHTRGGNMRPIWFLVAVAVLGPVLACGSGVNDGKLLADLSESERRTLCEYANDQLTEGTVVCNGQDFDVASADCEEDPVRTFPANCRATVADFERCVEVLGNNFCAQFEDEPPPECAPIYDDACVPTDIDRGI